MNIQVEIKFTQAIDKETEVHFKKLSKEELEERIKAYNDGVRGLVISELQGANIEINTKFED